MSMTVTPISLFFAKYRTTAKVITWLTVSAVFFLSGYQLRGLQARLVKAKAETSIAKEQTKAVVQARTDDKVTQVAADAIEKIRIDQAASNEKQFQIIYRDVVNYVQANPNNPACDADPEWLRIWNQSNAPGAGPEPDGTSGAAGGVSAGNGPATEAR
jgi:hypothetical protein